MTYSISENLDDIRYHGYCMAYSYLHQDKYDILGWSNEIKETHMQILDVAQTLDNLYRANLIHINPEHAGKTFTEHGYINEHVIFLKTVLALEKLMDLHRPNNS